MTLAGAKAGPAVKRPAVNRRTRQRTQLILALLTLVGFALRLPLLQRFPLREDEAIYGYWALHGWFVDPLFLQVWPDKPPILLWLLGAAFQLLGHAPATAEAAARWVSIVASTLTIPLLAVTARRWWGATAAVAAAALAALNPFALSFAPTAFTDPLLVLAGSFSLALAVRGRAVWAGVWLGIAIMTKQQGLLFAPLVVGAWAVGMREGGLPGSPPLPGSPTLPGSPPLEALRFLTGLALVILPVLIWDSLRWAVAPSPWDLGAANVGGVALLPLADWPARLAGWGQSSWYLLASPWAWAAYALGVLAAVVVTVRRSLPRRSLPPVEWLPALLLAAWAAAFALLHVATSVQVWDRYLLPLTVPLLLLGAWAAAPSPPGEGLPGSGGTSWKSLLLAFLLLAGIPPAWQAAQGQLPIGGDHGDYAGLNEALAAVEQPGSLLFHRELGWHARFTLFDAIADGALQLRYYPSSTYLADAATKAPHKQRFVIAPDWSPLPDLPLQLAMRGLQAHVVLRTGHFTVYRIAERPLGDASWRVCTPPRVGPFSVYEPRR